MCNMNFKNNMCNMCCPKQEKKPVCCPKPEEKKYHCYLTKCVTEPYYETEKKDKCD